MAAVVFCSPVVLWINTIPPHLSTNVLRLTLKASNQHWTRLIPPPPSVIIFPSCLSLTYRGKSKSSSNSLVSPKQPSNRSFHTLCRCIRKWFLCAAFTSPLPCKIYFPVRLLGNCTSLSPLPVAQPTSYFKKILLGGICLFLIVKVHTDVPS